MSTPAPSSASSHSPRPRVALIGISGYGSIYLAIVRAARDRGELDLVAAVVINPDEEHANEKELASHGCRIFRDYEAMLRDLAGQIDLCLIPTGIQWHARMTIAALKSGACVLVEKPLAGSLEETEQIRAAERETGRWVAVGFQDIYCPVNRWLKEQLLAGVIGQLTSVRFLGLWPRSSSYFARNHWAGRLVADGAPVKDSLLNNAFAHFVNLGLYFLGSTPDGSATVTVDSAELLRAHPIETFDTSVVQARTAEGARFWVGASHTTQRTLEPVLRLFGSRGSITWRHGEDVLVEPDGIPAERRKIPDIDQARQRMFDLVLARLRNPSVSICDTALAQAHTRFIEGVHAAAAGLPVPASRIEWATGASDERRWPVVHGLEEALERAFDTGSTLAEAGFTVTSPQS